MSFQNPLVLLGLIGLPLLVGWYLAQQRQRRRISSIFVSPALLPSVAPRRPRWRRHVPIAAFGLALGVLVVAAARPQRTVATPVKRSSVMLAIDVSGSMAATDVAPSRLAAVQAAAKRFLDGVPSSVSVGLMSFNQTPTVLQSPTTDHDAVRAALGQLHTGGGTAIGNAIQAAVRSLTAVPPGRTRPPAAILLLSDGTSTSGVDQVTAARAAGGQHIPVYTIALGTAQGTIVVPRGNGQQGTVVHRAPPDPQALAQVAQASGGRAYTATSAGRVSAVYQHLGAQLGHRKVKQEITAGFAGAGLALVLLGCALSLRWLGRLI